MRGVRDEDRGILRLAVPALGALATTPLYVLVDTAIVGHLGTGPLGGLAVATGVINLLFFVTRFLEYGMTARVARANGRGDRRGAAAAAVQGLWVGAGVAAVLAAAMVAGAGPLARLLGARGDVLANATTYLRISAAWVPFQLASLVWIGYLRGIQDTRTPLWVALGANAVNVALEVWFVYGLDWGIAGSAWGTVLATAVAAATFFAVGARDVRATGAHVRPDPAALRSLLRSGGHLSVRTGALIATLTASTAVAARVSDDALGGHQIALQVETFLALVVDALAIAGQALTGAALGAGDPAAAHAAAERLLWWGRRVGMALAAGVLAAAWVLPAAFSPDPGVRHEAGIALVGVAVLQPVGAVAFVLDGVLLGASDDAFQAASNLAALAAFAPFAAAVLATTSLGIAGVWAGLVAWMAVRAGANTWRFRSGAWARLEAGATGSAPG
jgi:putative MATE family efflux protein